MFKIYDGRSDFYQWDLNRQIVLSDPTINEVHFCNKTSDCSLVVAVYEKDGLRLADVPNILLQTDWPIRVYAYCGDCYTKTSDTFKVVARTRPDDYVYTETEVKRWEDLEKRVDDKITQLDVSEGDRVAAEEARAATEEAREAAEAERAETFSNLTNEANGLIDVLDNYYVPTVDNHERRITQLERHISNDYFVTDESTAYQKVLGDACPYAQVNSVGGMTYKTENLIPPPTRNWTSNGITFSVQEDGSIVANGTATSDATFELIKNGLAGNIKLAKGETYTFSGCPANGSNTTYRLVMQHTGYSQNFDDFGSGVTKVTSYEDYYVFILIYAGYTANNLVFRPMLNEGTTAKPYSPFFEGLRDTKVTELVSEGANLIPYPYSEAFSTKNGVTFAKSGGGVSVSGTASAFTTFYLMRKTAPASTYTLSCDALTSGVTVVASRYKAKANGGFEWISNIGDVRNTRQSITFEWTEEEAQLYVLGVHIGINEQTIVNLVAYPMLNRGTTAQPYKPYVGTLDTLPISAELRTFLEDKGYGKGVSGYPNYIDFERKVFVQNTYEVDIGSFNYEYRVSNGRNMFRASLASLGIQGQISANIPINALAEDYRAVSCNATWIDRDMAYGSTVVGYTAIEFVDNRYTSAAAFKEAVTGKKLLFALEKPIEHDISEYLTDENIIEVEGGGTITAINEYNNAAPSSITYLLKEGSV